MTIYHKFLFYIFKYIINQKFINSKFIKKYFFYKKIIYINQKSNINTIYLNIYQIIISQLNDNRTQ